MAKRGSPTDLRTERRWKRRLSSPQNPFRSRSVPPLPPTKRLCIEAHKSSPPHPIVVIDIDDDDDPPPPTIIDVSDSSSAGNHDHLDQTLHGGDDLQDQALHARDDHKELNFHGRDDNPEAESHDGGGKWDPEYKFFCESIKDDGKGNLVILENEVNARIISYEVPSNGSPETLNAEAKGKCVSDAIGLAIKSEMVGNGYCDGVVTKTPNVGRESLDLMEKMNGVLDNGGGGGLARNCEMNVNAVEVSVDMDADYKLFFDNMRREIEGNATLVHNYGMVADGFSGGFVAKMPKAERVRNAQIIGYGVPCNGSPVGFVTETPNANAVIEKVVDEMPCSSMGKTLSADAKGTRVSDAIGLAIKSEVVANGYCDGNVGRENLDLMKKMNGILDNSGDGNVMEVSVDMDADYKLFFDYMREEIEGNVLEHNVGDKITPLVSNHGMVADGFSGGFVAKIPEAERIKNCLEVMGEKNARLSDEGHGSKAMEAKSARPDRVGDDSAKDNCVPNGDGGIGVNLVPGLNDEGEYICVVSSDDSGDAEDPVSDCDGEANGKDCSKVNADDDTKYHCVSDYYSDDGEDHGVADVEYDYVFDGDDAKEHCASGGVDYICVSDSDDSGDAKDHVSDCGGEANGKDCSKVHAADDTKYYCVSDSDDGEDHGVDYVKYDSVFDGDDAKKHRASGGHDSIFGSKYDLDADDTVDGCYKIFLLCLKPDGETVDFTTLKGKTVNDHRYQSNEANRYKEEKSNTDKGLKTRCNSSSRGKLKFRKRLMNVLRKPYNQKEYEQLWYEVSKRKPVCKNRVLRGVTKQYSGNRIGKSYLDHHPDLASIIKSVKNDKPRVLNLLRGFFHWLKNLCHRGAFVPWKDSLFLETTSCPSVSKRSRGLNHKKVWRGPSKMYCELGIKTM